MLGWGEWEGIGIREGEREWDGIEDGSGWRVGRLTPCRVARFVVAGKVAQVDVL